MSLQVIKKASAAAPQTLAKAMSTSSSALPYTERQARLGRPVSPHVEIYSFPIVAISSISNRFASIGMALGFTATSALAAVGADVPSVIYAAQDAIPGFAPISKALVAFPISYHTLIAARHALWDVKPELITNADAAKSCYAVFGLAGFFTLSAAAYTIKTPAKKDE